MEDEKLTQKCLGCGKVKLIDKNFAKSPFISSGIELYCKTCKASMLISKDALIDYLKQHRIDFEETTYLEARKYVQDKELKKLKLKNIKDLPEDWENKLFNKICGRFFSIGNLNGKFKFQPLNNNGNKNHTDHRSNIKYYNHQWMGDYTEDEINYLEGYLKDLKKDFKIVTRNHFDYAMKIAQASLYMNKCYQDLLNGTPGAEAKYKSARETFDTLSKSAQFSENTRGANDVSLGCFGRVFEEVEKVIYVYKHKPIEKDSIDKLLDDFKHISKSI